jgi:3-dehydroquinate synthase
MGADRTTFILGIGGGLTTDVAGYVASTYLRGVRFGFVSTTLLGQVDASIGGKNGVNLDGYKNMIGVIRQPEFIWCDYSMLDTLPDREYRSGLAEVIKYGAIKDRNFLDLLDEKMGALINRDPDLLEEVILRCASIKAEIVQRDEKEGGERRLLNFGHTIGHAVERIEGLMHGEAISIGMVLASRISSILYQFPDDQAERLKSIISKAGLPVGLNFDKERIYDSIRKDKKKAGKQLHFIFLEHLGKAFTDTLDFNKLNNLLDDLHEHSKSI